VFELFAGGAYQLTSARGGVAELLAALAPGGGYWGCWCGLVVHFVGSTGGYTGCCGAAGYDDAEDEELYCLECFNRPPFVEGSLDPSGADSLGGFEEALPVEAEL